MTKRLFLFASYDKNNVVDDTVVHYVKHLSTLGDVIFIMDNNLTISEIKKISELNNVLHASAKQHQEYDFGSYKRGYIWAKDNKVLNNYDWLYFVNDSVYGPLSSLSNILSDIESKNADEVGLIENTEPDHPTHIQSWFVGFSKKIFTQNFFDEFMKKICREDNKLDIITKYEVRLSRLIARQGFKMSAFIKNDVQNNIEIYQYPINMLNKGLPFIKKRSINKIKQRHLLNAHSDFPDIIDKIYNHANIIEDTVYIPDKYVKKFKLTFLSLPIFSIRGKQLSKQYKIYLFDKIPIIKINK